MKKTIKKKEKKEKGEGKGEGKKADITFNFYTIHFLWREKKTLQLGVISLTLYP